jgi:hypothetical protein
MNINDRVNRIEDRATTGAVIIDIDHESASALIQYDEGGEGWWPLDSIAPEP